MKRKGGTSPENLKQYTEKPRSFGKGAAPISIQERRRKRAEEAEKAQPLAVTREHRTRDPVFGKETASRGRKKDRKICFLVQRFFFLKT